MEEIKLSFENDTISFGNADLSFDSDKVSFDNVTKVKKEIKETPTVETTNTQNVRWLTED